ncbi:MAG TPA: ABC transporter permease, partial [Lachnospiraceae bacterium]|nr:ABC transporter permease [Lachnospiraceae bacterium]
QLNENLMKSKVIREDSTIVLYSEEAFTGKDQESILEKYGTVIDCMVPIDTTFENIVVNNTFSSNLVLTTTIDFSKVNHLQLDRKVESDALYQDGQVVVGKNLVSKGKAKELQMGDSTYGIAAVSYNYEYASYVLRFQEKCDARRLDIVFKENIELDKARNAVVKFCMNEMGKAVQCKNRSEVRGTVNYYDGFLGKAVAITIAIILYSAINIVSIIFMKLEEEKRAIAIKFSVGARRIHIFIQKFIELFIIFSMASILAFMVLPMLVKMINLNLSFIVLNYSGIVVLYVCIINIICAIALSLWYIAKVSYRRVRIAIKK